MNSINNEEFDHSQLETHLFHLDSSTEIVIIDLQLHLPCLGNTQFGNGIKKARGSNKLV